VAQLTLKVNGYYYTVGCEDGQEEHLKAMAAEVERRIERIKTMGGRGDEARLLLLAALLMADELHDLKLAAASRPDEDRLALLAARLARLAGEAEAIAEHCEKA
jgi:cell division protein ZapA